MGQGPAEPPPVTPLVAGPRRPAQGGRGKTPVLPDLFHLPMVAPQAPSQQGDEGPGVLRKPQCGSRCWARRRRQGQEWWEVGTTTTPRWRWRQEREQQQSQVGEGVATRGRRSHQNCRGRGVERSLQHTTLGEFLAVTQAFFKAKIPSWAPRRSYWRASCAGNKGKGQRSKGSGCSWDKPKSSTASREGGIAQWGPHQAGKVWAVQKEHKLSKVDARGGGGWDREEEDGGPAGPEQRVVEASTV